MIPRPSKWVIVGLLAAALLSLAGLSVVALPFLIKLLIAFFLIIYALYEATFYWFCFPQRLEFSDGQLYSHFHMSSRNNFPYLFDSCSLLTANWIAMKFINQSNGASFWLLLGPDSLVDADASDIRYWVNMQND